jgi:hypothetical protein
MQPIVVPAIEGAAVQAVHRVKSSMSSQRRRQRFSNLAEAIEAFLARGAGVVSTRVALAFLREHLPLVEHTDRELEELVLLHAVRRSRTVICDSSFAGL